MGRPDRPADDWHDSYKERLETHPHPMDRRRFLATSSAAVAGGMLFSCTGGRKIVKVDDQVAKAGTRWPIKRVIYLMLENRSFDNMFGRFPGVNGSRTGVFKGQEVPLGRCPEWLPFDLPHDRLAAEAGLNGGQMDGFATLYNDDSRSKWAYTQFEESDVPSYWHWAREYALSDNFFASALGPSYPNHFFFVAGQSGGVFDNPENISVRWDGDKKFKSWGCDAYGDEVFVFAYDDNGNLNKREPCFEFDSVPAQLSRNGIDWRYYSASPYQTGYFWNALNGIGPLFHSDEWHHRTRGIDNLIQDIKNNDLPAVTWATPRFELSDHPPCSTTFSHNWVTDIVNEVMRSDMWEHTAIFITWDEWGGFYDHVTPPKVDEVGLGFRIPLLTISPYTKRGVIDDLQGEFSSPLKFIEDNWGLPYLTKRIEQTHNFEHIFDFNQKPRKPSFAPTKPTPYGSPWTFPEDFDGWPVGTEPAVNPF